MERKETNNRKKNMLIATSTPPESRETPRNYTGRLMLPEPSTPATSPPRFAFWTSVGARATLIDPLSLLVERLVRRLPASRRRQSTLNQPRGVGDIGTEGGDASRETERRARLHLRRRRIWRTGRARGLCGTPRAPARRRRRRRARRCRRQVARAAPVRREVRWLRLAGGERRGAESALSTCGRGRRGPASSPLA